MEVMDDRLLEEFRKWRINYKCIWLLLPLLCSIFGCECDAFMEASIVVGNEVWSEARVLWNIL